MAGTPLEHSKLYLPDDQQTKSGQRRLKDVELTVPICYGSVAFWLGKKASEYHSFKWTVYVRSATEECDVAPLISKVVFTLHPSFANAVRELHAPPYEVTETGWGEFDIGIQIVFAQDSGEDPIELTHSLKLYEDDGSCSVKKPVVVDRYEEVVFVSPGELFYNRAAAAGRGRGHGPPLSVAAYCPKHSDKDDVARIQAAQTSLQAQVAALRGAVAAGGGPGAV